MEKDPSPEKMEVDQENGRIQFPKIRISMKVNKKNLSKMLKLKLKSRKNKKENKRDLREDLNFCHPIRRS